MLGHVLPMVMGILGSGAPPPHQSSNPSSSSSSNVITVEGPSVNVGIPRLPTQSRNVPSPRSWPPAFGPMGYPPHPYSPYAMPNYYPYGQPYGGYSPALSRWTRMIHDPLGVGKEFKPQRVRGIRTGIECRELGLPRRSRVSKN